MNGLYFSRRFCPIQNFLGVLQEWHIDHLAIQRVRTFAFLLTGSERLDNSLAYSIASSEGVNASCTGTT